MKITRNISLAILSFFFFLFISCEDFLEVEPPNHKMVSELVFTDDKLAMSAMTGVYNELFLASFSQGSANSVTVLSGLSADELQVNWEVDYDHFEFDNNEILPSNNLNLGLWSSAYNIIYLTNSILEGVENSDHLSESVRTFLEGEAKFVRAFSYFYLVNLYGDVPLILSTDYRINSLASRVEQSAIYQQIVLDLNDALNLLEDDYRDGDRTRVNRYAVMALLSRVNLYLEKWEEAERLSSMILGNSNQYQLQEDLNQTFLANSKEALWQISPIGRGGSFTYTFEGDVFLFNYDYPTLTKVSLEPKLIELFDSEDQRFLNWIGHHSDLNKYYSTKYKDDDSRNNITEYSMVLRLAEQYLIRAEARLRQGNFSGAISDINVIRERAGTTLLDESYENMSEDDLLEIILNERRKELFTEWGHRWLDLKRTDQIMEFIGVSQELYPIPEEERMKNPNLGQNQGY